MGIITASRALAVTPQSGGVFVNAASASFNGTTQYASVTSATFGSFDHQNFAISVWLKTLGSGTTFSQAGTSWSTNAFRLDVLSSGAVYAEGRFSLAGSYAFNFTSTAIVNDGNWHHIYLLYDGVTGTGLLTIDGTVQSGSNFSAGSLQTVTDSIRVGLLNTTDGGYFNGLIDEVSFFSGTTPAVTDLRDSTTGQPKDLTGLAGLHAWWRMENDWLDSSGNGRNLTPVGSPTFSASTP